MTTPSPESTPTTPEIDYPVSYAEFVAEHPTIPEIRQKVYDTLDTRISYEGNPDAPNYDEWPKQSDIEGYLGAGYEKSAYLVDDEFVVKIQNKRYGSDGEYVIPPAKQVSDLKRGLGIEGLEQLVTADLEEGVLVTKLAKGSPITEISSKELVGKISKEHISKLEATLKHMVANLLEFDNPHNVLFDPEEGFTVVDFRTPLGLQADKTYSTNPEDENYSSFYEDFISRHALTSALDELLSSEKKQIKGMYNPEGELEHHLKPTLGRHVIKSLVKLKRR